MEFVKIIEYGLLLTIVKTRHISCVCGDTGACVKNWAAVALSRAEDSHNRTPCIFCLL